VVDRPRIGISACLLGEPVRYDGAHKRDAWLVEVLGPQVEWVAVCPEVEAGFGTPREPVQLERDADGAIAMMTVRTRCDVTETMQRYTSRRVAELADEHLDGYVFKADSPSCDPGEGLFARALIARLPGLPVIDERRLTDPAVRTAFVEDAFAHHRAWSAKRSAGLSGERPAGRSESVALGSAVVVRVHDGARVSHVDRTAVEEPLEIRLHGQPFAVIMRTPGADKELAAGFLLAERVIHSADDLGVIEYCTDTQPQSSPRSLSEKVTADSAPSAVAFRNVVNVTLADPSHLERLLADRRNVQTNSSCGLCGRRTIESLASDAAPIRADITIPSSIIVTLPHRLRAGQAVFDETGGLHAAALVTADGELVDLAEDVGRHNAVDKVIGRMLMRDRLPLSDYLLFVSGRTSFEIVQKALFAGIPMVAAVSAPSSLAIDLAQEFGITLIGFVRGETFNIYAHADRVTPP